MCCIYFIDYTTVANYSKVIGFGMLRVSAVSLLLFYIPIYGAILYKYRNGGVGALIMSLVWLISHKLVMLFI